MVPVLVAVVAETADAVLNECKTKYSSRVPWCFLKEYVESPDFSALVLTGIVDLSYLCSRALPQSAPKQLHDVNYGHRDNVEEVLASIIARGVPPAVRKHSLVAGNTLHLVLDSFFSSKRVTLLQVTSDALSFK